MREANVANEPSKPEVVLPIFLWLIWVVWLPFIPHPCKFFQLILVAASHRYPGWCRTLLHVSTSGQHGDVHNLVAARRLKTHHSHDFGCR